MDSFKLIPIGGIGGVTKNMYVYQYGEEIMIVDCGIGFPTNTMPGIDVLIPDVSYLKERQHMIKGMLLTHAHDDHIAALPYILPEFDVNFPIYGSKLTIAFAKDRLREYKIPADFREFNDRDGETVGPFEIESVKVTHSVPDARHFAVHTPQGTVYHGSDFKFDLTPVDGVVTEYNKISRIGDEGVLCLLSDCLRSEKNTHSLSESILTETFQREFRDVKGKLIVTSMSSNIHRIQQVVDIAVSYGRKVSFIGRSIESNMKTAMKMGFVKLNEKNVVHKRKIEKMNPSEICVIIAGSQGQPESSLARAANGDHRLITINKEDKVVFSSEPIPGNEDNVYTAIDAISKIGADISYSDINDNLHVSGHASAIEQQLLMELVKPQFLVPIGGTYRHMVQYRKLAKQMNFDERQVFLLEDGESLAMSDNKVSMGMKLNLKDIMVDGTGVGDVGSIVLQDRTALSDSGIVVVNITVDKETKVPFGEVQIISRGFVFMKESQELVSKIQDETWKVIDKHQDDYQDWGKIRREIELAIKDLLYALTQREPLVLPVTIEV